MTKNMRPAETANVNPKVENLGRRLRRVMARGSHIPGPTGRAPRRTGQPEWFRRMKWEQQQKVLLGRLPVSELARHGICSEKQATALAEAGFKTVWDVVDAQYSALLKVTGFGPKTLAKLWQDAKIKGQLTVKWMPDGR